MTIARARRLRGATLLLLAVATGCQGTPEDPASEKAAVGSTCAQLVLHAEPLGWRRVVGVSSSQLPIIGVDLVDVPTTDSTVLTVSPCSGPAAPVSRTITGSSSFVVDATWLNATSGCFRLSAVAQHTNVQVGAGTLTVRRGDYRVRGTVTSPPTQPGSPPLPEPNAHVTALVSGLQVGATTDDKGQFTIENVPAGRLFLVSADGAAPRSGAPRHGETAPRLTLDAKHPEAVVQIMLADPLPAADRFEPDDVVADANKRQPLAVRTPESHTLPAHDVDLIPIAVKVGNLFEAHLQPRGDRPADLALAVIKADGTVIGHVNDTPAYFTPSPTLRFSAQADGTLYLRVARNDDESSTAAYELTLNQIIIY